MEKNHKLSVNNQRAEGASATIGVIKEPHGERGVRYQPDLLREEQTHTSFLADGWISPSWGENGHKSCVWWAEGALHSQGRKRQNTDPETIPDRETSRHSDY